MKTAIIVSTYNRPLALKLCLESIRNQTVLPDEVIIADDGSADDTKKLIQEIAEDFPVKLIHVWQPDEGFQLAKIRNKAVAASSSDFIIQIDGDVLLHKEYVEDFIKIARENRCILGSRVGLGPKLTTQIESSQIIPKIYPWTRGIIQKPLRALYSKAGRWISKSPWLLNKKNKSQGLGCSMAFWKKDFIAVNGYDERFVGWGCEDRDLLLRLGRMGVLNHKLLFAGIVYHLWHKEGDRSQHMSNRAICYGDHDAVCEKGISQYL